MAVQQPWRHHSLLPSWPKARPQARLNPIEELLPATHDVLRRALRRWIDPDAPRSASEIDKLLLR